MRDCVITHHAVRIGPVEGVLNHQEWLETVPEAITGDALWKTKVYRLALFAADLGWRDVTTLMQDRRTVGLSE